MPSVDVLRKLGHRRWFARIGRGYVPLDRLVGRPTRGRVVGGRLLGLPSLVLTTTGRRSGLPRTTPLLYLRDGDGFVVIGSNWGLPAHPAWSANLLEDPQATVTVGGRRVPVLGVLATGVERERLWRMALQVWPAYATYAERAGRVIRVFRLEP